MTVSSYDKPGLDWLKRSTKKISAGGELAVTPSVASAVEVEAWLQDHKVEYAPPTGIPMTMIDEKRSRGNQARRDPLVSESVDRFTAALKAGGKFPPIVVYPLGGKLVIIDGNNRQASAKRAGREYILGIIISAETPSEMIQLLTVEANARHGVTPELAWRLKQAFHLIELGHSDQAAADAAAVTLPQLKSAKAVQEADARARALKIFGFAELPATSRQYLNTLKDEPIFYQAARLAAGSKFGIDEVRDLVRQTKTQKSEADRLALIAEYAKERTVAVAAKKAASKGVSAPKQALVAGIGLLLNCDEGALVTQIVTPHDRDVINRRLGEAVDKILAIQVAMESLSALGDD